MSFKVSLGFIFILSVFVLTGCGGGGDDESCECKDGSISQTCDQKDACTPRN